MLFCSDAIVNKAGKGIIVSGQAVKACKASFGKNKDAGSISISQETYTWLTTAMQTTSFKCNFVRPKPKSKPEGIFN
jgi:hypothetical protein